MFKAQSMLLIIGKVVPKIKPALIMISGVLVAITAYHEYVKQHLPTEEKPTTDNGHVEQSNTTPADTNS